MPRATRPRAPRSGRTAAWPSWRRSRTRPRTRPACGAGDVIDTIDGDLAGRPHPGRGALQDPRPEGHGRAPGDRARRHAPGDRDRAGRDRHARGGDPDPGRRDGRLHPHVGVLGSLGGRTAQGRDGGRRGRPDEADPGPPRQPRWLRDGRARCRQPVPGRRHGLLGGGRERQPDRVRGQARRGGDGPEDPAGRARGRGLGVGVGDRGRRAPGPRAREARRDEDVRQGHRPAVDAARGRQRRVPPDDRQVADAGQDLGPRHRDHAGRGGGRRAREAGRRPGPGRRAGGAGRAGDGYVLRAA